MVDEMKYTELGNIPNEWDVKTLGDVGEVRMCKRVFSHQTKSQGQIPFYKIGTFNKEPDAYITQELYNNFRQRFSFPKKGDILISAAGTIGRTWIYDGKPAYFQDSNIVWIENNEELISNNFLNHILQVVKYNTEGGTIQRLYNSILRNTKFICPPTDVEQRDISNALNDADTLINKLEKLLTKKRNIKIGAMQELLKPKSEWLPKQLGEVVDINMGQSPDSKNYNSNQVGLPLLQGNADLENRKQVIRFWTSQTTKTCDAGDLILTVRAPVGSIGFAIQKSCIGRGVCSLKVKSVSKYFIYHLLIFKEKDWKILEQGSTFTSANSNQIYGFEITIPKTETEQNHIAQILSDMDNDIQEIENQLQKQKMMKQGMMQDLLNGKIRINQEKKK